MAIFSIATDPKTTVAGAMAALVTAAKAFGLEIPQGVSEGALAVIFFLWGLLGGDSKK